MDRIGSLLRGAGQTLTGGWGDEAIAKLQTLLPMDDGTGIPREYAGGQYEQYRDQERADNAEAQRKYPLNYAAGGIVGALPAMIATGGLGGLGGVAAGTGLGALQGAGFSEREGTDLAKDAAIGGALGGGLAAGGEALKHVGKLAGPALAQLRQNGPPSPALATAGAGGAPQAQLNMSKAQELLDQLPSRQGARPTVRPAPSKAPTVPAPAEAAPPPSSGGQGLQEQIATELESRARETLRAPKLGGQTPTVPAPAEWPLPPARQVDVAAMRPAGEPGYRAARFQADSIPRKSYAMREEEVKKLLQDAPEELLNKARREASVQAEDINEILANIKEEDFSDLATEDVERLVGNLGSKKPSKLK